MVESKKLVTRFNLDQSFVFCDDHITLWSSFDKKLKLSRMSVEVSIEI